MIAGRLSLRSAGALKILDGQHERRAIRGALESLIQDKRRVNKLSSLQDTAAPIMLYAESGTERLRQMLSDAAKNRMTG